MSSQFGATASKRFGSFRWSIEMPTFGCGRTPERRPPDPGHPHRWVRWADFWLPADRGDARAAFAEALLRARAGERVEAVCAGGRGRTGTAIACVAQLAGVDGLDAVAWTRAHHHPRAVETPWQRRYVRRFGAVGSAGDGARNPAH